MNLKIETLDPNELFKEYGRHLFLGLLNGSQHILSDFLEKTQLRFQVVDNKSNRDERYHEYHIVFKLQDCLSNAQRYFLIIIYHDSWGEFAEIPSSALGTITEVVPVEKTIVEYKQVEVKNTVREYVPK